MNLEEYKQFLISEIETFEEWYKDHQESYPETFANDHPIEDWDEMFYDTFKR